MRARSLDFFYIFDINSRR